MLVLSFIIALNTAGPPVAPSPQPAASSLPHGGAFVTTLPAGASAWLDGSYVGPTPVFIDGLLPGHHAVTISRPGWQAQSASFDVFAGHVTPVSVVMARQSVAGPLPPALKGQGFLSVRGGDPGAHVYVDGTELGVAPVDAHPIEAGFHIVTLETSGKPPVKSIQVVDVYPDSTTSVQFSLGNTSAAATNPSDDILEPLDSYVSPNSYAVAGDVITIHVRGAEVECAIGSRTYTFNGKAATLAVPPALVAGKIYLPLSLLSRLVGK